MRPAAEQGSASVDEPVRPVAPPPGAPAAPGQPRRWGCVPLAALALVAGSLSTQGLPWQLIDQGARGSIIAAAAALCLLSLALYGGRLRRVGRLRGPGGRQLAGLAALSVVMIPAGTTLALLAHRVVNCALDPAPPARLGATVEHLSTAQGASRRYLVWLDRTPQRASPQPVEVPLSLFATLREGQRITIETRPGRLGREWCAPPCITP
jgi:hypothetical protein